MPPQVVFATKWQQMLGLIDRMLGLGLEELPFVGDAGYGDVAEFRRQLTVRKRPYLLEVMSTTAVWAPGTGPQPPEGKMGKMGRPRTQYHDGEHLPLSVTELALSQTEQALVLVRWKNGDGPDREGRFAAVRLQPANGHCQGLAPEPEQWLIWEWPEGQELPEHYWLSTLPADTPLERLVYLAKLRWRVERDYQEMKAEVGLDHYEGRSWPGLHHHWVLCAVAHGFLVLQRARWQQEAEVDSFDDVEVELGRHPQAFAAVRGDLDDVLLAAQRVAQHPAGVGVVLDDEQPHRTSAGRVLGMVGPRVGFRWPPSGRVQRSSSAPRAPNLSRAGRDQPGVPPDPSSGAIQR